MKHICCLLALYMVATSIHAQTKTELTVISTDSISKKVDINALGWLAGYWQGHGMGGIVEEVWTPASAGSMMCVFKFFRDNEVQFYEIITISEVNESLALRLKHFDRNLHGWEEKAEVVEFPFVEITENRVVFEGLTFEKVSDREMKVYVDIQNGDTIREMVFRYTRQPVE